MPYGLNEFKARHAKKDALDSRITSMTKKLPNKKYMPDTKKLTSKHLSAVKQMSKD